MYCNRSKHTCSIETEYSYSLFGDESSSAIVPFFRKDTTTSTQYDKKEISDFIPKTYDFITAAYEGFLDAIKKEVIKKQYVINRFFSLSVFQQKIKGSPESSFSMPYMYADIDMNAMPEKIQVLLIKEWKENGRIVAKNSPFDTIYVKDKKVKDNPYTYIGKYVADDSIGEDSLLRFRQYTKVTPQEGEPPLIIQAMTDNKQKGMFYHKNPFFEIDTVSDDDDFIKRTSLPF